jgi:hypothetical protein
MKNTWVNLYKNVLNYKNIFNKKESTIKTKYDLLRKELDKKEKEELDKISKTIDKKVNKENYDIFCNYYDIDRQLGFEIGKQIRIKLKKDAILLERDLDYREITENLIFTLILADYREGTYMYHSFVEGELEDKTYYVDTLSIVKYFNIIEVVKEFKPLDYTKKELHQHKLKGNVSEEIMKAPIKN